MGFRELIDNYFFSQYSISIKITKKDVLEKLLMNTIVKHKRRFVVYCFFYIDIEDNYYKEGSKYSKEFLEQKFPSISKFISKKIRNFKKVKH